jgi:DNA-directed RNA polymerase specialized sigma24 family protein
LRRSGLASSLAPYTEHDAAQNRFDVIGRLATLRRYARSLTRNDVNAEDLVHDALVRA